MFKVLFEGELGLRSFERNVAIILQHTLNKRTFIYVYNSKTVLDMLYSCINILHSLEVIYWAYAMAWEVFNDNQIRSNCNGLIIILCTVDTCILLNR